MSLMSTKWLTAGCPLPRNSCDIRPGTPAFAITRTHWADATPETADITAPADRYSIIPTRSVDATCPQSALSKVRRRRAASGCSTCSALTLALYEPSTVVLPRPRNDNCRGGEGLALGTGGRYSACFRTDPLDKALSCGEGFDAELAAETVSWRRRHDTPTPWHTGAC